jgi:hypothetical protein
MEELLLQTAQPHCLIVSPTSRKVVRNHALDALNELSEIITKENNRFNTLELISAYQSPSSSSMLNIRRTYLSSEIEGREEGEVLKALENCAAYYEAASEVLLKMSSTSKEEEEELVKQSDNMRIAAVAAWVIYNLIQILNKFNFNDVITKGMFFDFHVGEDLLRLMLSLLFIATELSLQLIEIE